jgi:2-polyprenyl-3-methyl-5-hydroxy-6-metoxy-1,4-benzoquinol methylase
MSNEYKPHMLEWTDEKVEKFWNFRNNYKPYDNTWFTQQAGPAVLKLVNSIAPIKGKILDYGTGKGYLVDYLLTDYSNAEIYACDFTEDPAKETDQKNKDKKMFRGCNHITSLPSVYDDNYFDMVFLIETIEHLTDNYLQGTLKEIHRILKLGGTIVITTPNDEDLEKTHVHCADCGATFHHMQHIRSWNVNNLGKLMNEFTFRPKFCSGVNIQWYGKNGYAHLLVDRLKNAFRTSKNANLVYIGKK